MAAIAIHLGCPGRPFSKCIILRHPRLRKQGSPANPKGFAFDATVKDNVGRDFGKKHFDTAKNGLSTASSCVDFLIIR
jgi:hypothetical protein